VAALTGDRRYVQAIDRIWENAVGRKLYLTGGIGARAEGEAFGDDYELPNLSAYDEACAAVGNDYWNHRLFLLHGDSRYIDVLERTLYNGLLSGVSLDGKAFFYPNPLESNGQHQRSPWFGVACCPGNITRFMPSLPGYIYAQRGDSTYVNLFIGRVVAAPDVAADRGRVAIQRGPIVYAAEWPDNPDGHVRNLRLPDDAGLSRAFRPALLNGVEVLTGQAMSYVVDAKGDIQTRTQPFTAIPYYAWANRGPGEMIVWLARDEPAVRPQPFPTVASSSSVRTSSGRGVHAINDQAAVHSSYDQSEGYFHFWPHRARPSGSSTPLRTMPR